MTRKYNYHSIKQISKKGIMFHDDYFMDFELCRLNWAKKNNIAKDECFCVAERDVTAKPPYFLFYAEEEVMVSFKKDFFSLWDKNFHKLKFFIDEVGYSTFDLS